MLLERCFGCLRCLVLMLGLFIGCLRLILFGDCCVWFTSVAFILISHAICC